MGNSASSLPYSIGKQVAFVNNGWALHEGSRKSDGSPVSVFLAKKPALQKAPVSPRQPSMMQYAAAHHHFTSCKKLRHPHILTVTATLDTDNPNDVAPTAMGNNGSTSAAQTKESGDFIIVTEPCLPLDTWLQTRPPPEQLAWGLECMIRSLHFLHSSAGLSHGAVSPESFYVTPSGDVKLWNWSLVASFTTGTSVPTVPRHFVDWESLITPMAYRAPERVEGRWDAIAAAGVHCVDCFSLGGLVSHMFGGIVPTPLVKAVQKLQTTNLKMRPRSLQPLLKCPVFDTPYQKLQLQLEEFAVAGVEQKTNFWHNLTPNLQAQVVPEQVAVYKLLPLMLSEIETICGNEGMRTQESYRKEVLTALNPLFYIAENFLDSATVGKQLGKVVGILFKVNDRAIRGTLLQKAPFMAESFDKNTLNEAVFEPMCSGFSDSSAALRELTLKATAALVPYLTHPNLEKLSRYLVRLQSDPESSIRTNTVIFFSKLAPFLTETTRQKMLLPAFERAMKDPFTPCRLAALRSTLKAKEFFDPMGIASRVLPAITPQLLDPSAEVRREALIAVDDLLFVLRQESERLNRMPEPTSGVLMSHATANAPMTAMPGRQPSMPSNAALQQPPSSAPSVPATKSGSSFSLGGISSWMSSSKGTATPNASSTTGTPGLPAAQAHAEPNTTAPDPYIGQQHSQIHSNNVAPSHDMSHMSMNDNFGDEDDMGDDADGWDDDLDVSAGGDKHFAPSTSAYGAQSAAVPAQASSGSLFAANGSEDDFFGSFDAKPAKPVAMRTMGGTGSKLVVPAKKAVAKPAVTKLPSKDSGASDGWDDF